MFKRKRVGKFSDPALEELEVKRRAKRGKPVENKATIWSGSGAIDAGQLGAGRTVTVTTSRVVFTGRSDVGRMRQNNEDSYCIGAGFAGVFDGLGGAAAGEVASAMAAQRMASLLNDSSQVPTADAVGRRLVVALKAANLEVFKRSKADPECRGMATTATVAALVGHRLFIAQVGDSRAYLLRRGKIAQVTEDQTVAAELMKLGKSREEAECAANVLTCAVGMEAAIDPVLSPVDLYRGDVLLLCSDGLTDMLSDEEIQRILMGSPNPYEACAALVAAANQAGGRDNVTAVVGWFNDLPELHIQAPLPGDAA